MNSSVFHPKSSGTGSFPQIRLSEAVGSKNYVVIAVVIALLIIFKSHFFKDERASVPIVGYRWFWEPAWLLRLRFITNSFSIITEGYKKYKDGIFIVRRCDTDLAIISTKYIDEIRKLPESTISVNEALIQNLVGAYSGITDALADDIHNRVLLRELTPKIGLFLDPLRDELDYAIKAEMPQLDGDWVEIDIQEVLLRIIARLSSRIFVGFPLCRDPEWLQVSMDTTVNAFGTAMSLRMLPSFLHVLHPLIVRFVPFWYRLANNHKQANKLLIPVIKKHIQERSNGDTKQEEISTLLNWMSDSAANEKEAAPENLAHQINMLGLGSIHTIKSAISNIIYDICAYPEFMAEIRGEVEEVMLDRGKWDKVTFTKLWKMDSLMLESQRINPPQLLTFNHRVMKPITLSDGTKLPVSTQLAVPSAALGFDPDLVENPEKFDPLRSYRTRCQSDDSVRNQFSMTSKTRMYFGHGKHACPGRTFANYEIKLIVAALLIQFDFRQMEGKGRPRNIMLDEFVFPEPGVNIMTRRRTVMDGIPRLAA